MATEIVSACRTRVLCCVLCRTTMETSRAASRADATRAPGFRPRVATRLGGSSSLAPERGANLLHRRHPAVVLLIERVHGDDPVHVELQPLDVVGKHPRAHD